MRISVEYNPEFSCYVYHLTHYNELSGRSYTMTLTHEDKLESVYEFNARLQDCQNRLLETCYERQSSKGSEEGVEEETSSGTGSGSGGGHDNEVLAGAKNTGDTQD